MNYFRQTSAQGFIGFRLRLLTGYLLVSIGILLAAGGGSWDINNHLLNKPETFFAPPHAVLYSGVATAIAGAFMLFSTSRRLDYGMSWPIKVTLAGILVLV